MQDGWQKYVAEAFATFIFVFVAAGAVLANIQAGGSLGTVGVAMATGLTFAAMLYATLHISGGYMNPAVVVTLWATGHIKFLTGVSYLIAQLIGSVVAALFLKVIFEGIVSPQFFLGDVMLNTTPGMGILIEALLTFFLVWAIFAAIIDKKGEHSFGPLVAGMILMVAIMIGGSFTMGALNPARSFGPALISSNWVDHYIYWVGPLIGALVAGFVYHFGFLKRHLG